MQVALPGDSEGLTFKALFCASIKSVEESPESGPGFCSQETFQNFPGFPLSSILIKGRNTKEQK